MLTKWGSPEADGGAFGGLDGGAELFGASELGTVPLVPFGGDELFGTPEAGGGISSTQNRLSNTGLAKPRVKYQCLNFIDSPTAGIKDFQIIQMSWSESRADFPTQDDILDIEV